jgi:hypothetical protein
MFGRRTWLGSTAAGVGQNRSPARRGQSADHTHRLKTVLPAITDRVDRCSLNPNSKWLNGRTSIMGYCYRLLSNSQYLWIKIF